MTQQTEIKVKIDDNEALSQLREMLAIVERLGDGLGGLEIPTPSGPSSTKLLHKFSNVIFCFCFGYVCRANR